MSAAGTASWRYQLRDRAAHLSGRPPGQVFIPHSPRAAGASQWVDVHELGVESRVGPLQPHFKEAFRKINSQNLNKVGYMPKKISAGLILVRTPEQTFKAKDRHGGRREYQAIVIRGRISYAFNEFVLGHYDLKRSDGMKAVGQLIANMTMEERRVVSSLDFDKMWDMASAPELRSARRWRPGASNAFDSLRARLMQSPGGDDSVQLARKREFFRANWTENENNSHLLRRMLYTAEGSGETRWEFPKGKRTSNHEVDVQCALREFREETGVSLGSVILVPGFCKVEMYVHMSVLYVNVFYAGVLHGPSPDLDSRISLMNGEQAAEVVEVTWMGMPMLKRINGPVGRNLSLMGGLAFKACKNYIRGRSSRPCIVPESAGASQAAEEDHAAPAYAPASMPAGASASAPASPKRAPRRNHSPTRRCKKGKRARDAPGAREGAGAASCEGAGAASRIKLANAFGERSTVPEPSDDEGEWTEVRRNRKPAKSSSHAHNGHAHDVNA